MFKALLGGIVVLSWWPVAVVGGLWPVAGEWGPVAGGRRWPVAGGRRPAAGGWREGRMSIVLLGGCLQGIVLPNILGILIINGDPY